MKSGKKIAALALAAALTTSLLGSSLVFADSGREKDSEDGRWVAGDFHTHTYLTDGNNTEKEVVDKAFGTYGLDWMANSEHGGTSGRDINGNLLTSLMWRWLSLKDLSFPVVKDLRNQYPNNMLVQGVEWNVPTHEHASVGIVADEPTAVSNFEYMFDKSDKDTSRAAEGLVKDNTTHASAVNGAKWLQDNYPDASYFLLNHPSRALSYSAADIRDFNNAAPDVAFGFEGLPGHQKESSRGGYGNPNLKAQTYGGTDYMVAKVGGLWDSLLGEGRNFWVFVNSDFHGIGGDFWPGEYGKSYTFVKGEAFDEEKNDDKKEAEDKNEASDKFMALIDGMRSGNTFAVEGDLINGLEFGARSKNKSAVMGQDLMVKKGNSAQITIKFKSPKTNNNGDAVKVDHIDLIAGDITGKAQPGTPEYSKDTNDTTKVIATFTSKNWKKEDGWYTIKYDLKKVAKDQYFRLRGTNQGLNVQNETDAQGNPLVDSLAGANTPAKAYSDLWFYSNPVFVYANK